MVGVVADSSFFILFYSDLNCKNSLHQILMVYDVYVGETIKKEINKHIDSDENFERHVIDVSSDVNFTRILKDFYNYVCQNYPNLSEHIADGEWEAMGISYFLEQNGNLQYLIIDENYAHNFIKKRLRTLQPYLVRTLRFLYMGCLEDRQLSKIFVLNIYNEIKTSLDKGDTPLYLTKAIWEKDVIPLINDLRGEK